MEKMGSNIKAIKIQILFFGHLSESIGQKSIEVVSKEGTNIGQLLERFQLSGFLETGSKISINDEFCEDLSVILTDSSEVALLPPFSGG